MPTQLIPEPLQTIAAILPSYKQSGDSTSILTATGTCIVSPIGIRSMLKRLAKERAIDLSALKLQAEQITGQRILHPLLLANDLVLVPVKVRTPLVSRDNCTGYINACCVASIQKALPPYKSLIILQSGAEILTLWTVATVESHLRAARLLTVNHGKLSIAQPELLAISRKLVEVFHDILTLKSH